MKSYGLSSADFVTLNSHCLFNCCITQFIAALVDSEFMSIGMDNLGLPTYGTPYKNTMTISIVNNINNQLQ